MTLDARILAVLEAGPMTVRRVAAELPGHSLAVREMILNMLRAGHLERVDSNDRWRSASTVSPHCVVQLPQRVRELRRFERTRRRLAELAEERSA